MGHIFTYSFCRFIYVNLCISRSLRHLSLPLMTVIYLSFSLQVSHHSVADDVERVLSEGTPKLKLKGNMALKKSAVKEPRKHSPLKKNISLDSLRKILGYQAQDKSDEELKLLIQLIQAQ